jgi:hypothetical protein
MDLRAGESAGFVPTGADAVTAAKIRLATHRAAAGAACAPQHAAGALVGPEGVVLSKWCPHSQVLSAQKRCPHSQVLAWKGAPTRRCSAYRPARLRSPPNRELRSLRGRRRARGTHGPLERAARVAGSSPPPIRSQALRASASRRASEKQSRERILGEVSGAEPGGRAPGGRGGVKRRRPREWARSGEASRTNQWRGRRFPPDGRQDACDQSRESGRGHSPGVEGFGTFTSVFSTGTGRPRQRSEGGSHLRASQERRQL